MEPLSAFSLACNILQIVEYGANVLSRAVEYRTAPDGALDQHNTLYEVLQSLKGLNAELSASLPSSSSPYRATTSGVRLAVANKECMRIANELITLLERLKVKKSSTLEGLRMSIKSIWYEGKVKALKHDLGEAKDDLSFAFMLFTQQSGAAKQAELLRSNDESERHIINTFNSASSLLSSEIQALAAQINKTSLPSVDDALKDFRRFHRDALAELSCKLDSILSHQETGELLKRFSLLSEQYEVAQQRIIDSLAFSQSDERRNKIQRAHRSTYEWALHPEQSQRQFDNLLSWARSNEGIYQVYWIYGKPGSGKSTLMRYLFDELNEDLHFHPWSENETVLKIDYFFWAPGTPLQKSFIGLLRSLLAQLLSRVPHIIPKVVKPIIWNRARSASMSDINWTSSDLIQTIKAIVSTEALYTFFLLDGLDEFEGTDQERDDFLDLIDNLSSFSHVKLCVSSRPWNIFRDAFDQCPKLRLEDHTREDIHSYIHQELNSQRRFKQLRQYDPSSAEILVHKILNQAAGVFLWVRLVVYELVKSLRDGDNMHQLLRKVEVMPKDLDAYFTHLMGSIESQHHMEASIFLQLALHEEHEFITLHPLRLLDVACIEDSANDSTLKKGFAAGTLDFADPRNLEFHLDSALRRINSRCLGLLECQYVEGSTELGYNISAGVDATNFKQISDWQISFLHRSFRDFLSLPSSQRRLYEYSGGTVNIRVLLCNARLTQMEALERIPSHHDFIVGLASYVICALSVPELRNTRYCEIAAGRLKPILERLMHSSSDQDSEKQPWYICRSLRSYHRDGSSFLTTAIDFNLSAYVYANLTRDAIREKKRRPILDYILRGLFSHESSMSIGNQLPDLKLLQRALQLGADPNEITDFGSPWVLFLDTCYDALTSFNDTSIRLAREVLLRAVALLLRYGASPVMPATANDGRPSVKCSHWRGEAHANSAADDPRRMTLERADLTPVYVASYLALLRPYCVSSAELLEDCIVLASRKLAGSLSTSNAVNAATGDQKRERPFRSSIYSGYDDSQIASAQE